MKKRRPSWLAGTVSSPPNLQPEDPTDRGVAEDGDKDGSTNRKQDAPDMLREAQFFEFIRHGWEVPIRAGSNSGLTSAPRRPQARHSRA